MKYDFVVIGAGVSGLTSAVALAQNGRRVALLEKADRTAPLLRGFSRRGVQFDTGFHYAGGLGAGGALEIFLRYLGISDRIESFPFAKDGFDVFRCERPGFEFRFPTGYERLRDSLCSAFSDERPAIDAYLARVRAGSAAMPYLNLDAGAVPDSALRRVLGATLRQTLDALTGNELLKSVLSMHCLLYGVSGDQVSFAQHAAIVGSYYQSARGIRGGGLSLAQAFDARLAELGVDVVCAGEATGIEVAPGGEISGVRLLGGAKLACTGVIATVHPKSLLELAPAGAFRPAYKKRLGALEETVSAFICFAVCADPIPSLAGSNRFLIPDAACLREFGSRAVGEAPLYLSAAYRPGELAPGGFVGITPAVFAEMAPWDSSQRGSRPADYRQFKERALERMRGQIERVYPDLSGTIRSIEGATPLTMREFCGSPAGGLYGVKHMVGQYNPQPTTRMPGLLLAGQAVVAPGVMGGVLSGLIACGAVLGHDFLKKELKACC